MRGYELQKARAQRRADLRHSASLAGFVGRQFLALDGEDLARRASPDDQGAHGNAVKRRLLVGALRAANLSDALIAEAWATTTAALDRDSNIPLVDARGTAADIERQVVDEIPEDEEPGRVVPPEPAIAPAWARGERVAGS